MDQPEVLIEYRNRSREAKIRLLLEASHQLTMVGRGAYHQGEIEKPEMLIRINEFQHRLLQIIIDLVDGQPTRGDEEVSDYLFAGFTEFGAIHVLAQALVRGR